MEGDRAYFARRAQEEYAAAMRASNLNARGAHTDMARRYSALAWEIARHELAWGIGEEDPLLHRDLRHGGGAR